MEKTHPIKRLKAKRDLTYREIAAKVRKANNTDIPTDHTIVAIATGQFDPSPKMAKMIQKAFPADFPSREELIYFNKEARESVKQAV